MAEISNSLKYNNFDEYYGHVWENLSTQTLNAGILTKTQNELQETIHTMYRIDIPAEKCTVILDDFYRNYRQILNGKK